MQFGIKLPQLLARTLRSFAETHAAKLSEEVTMEEPIANMDGRLTILCQFLGVETTFFKICNLCSGRITGLSPITIPIGHVNFEPRFGAGNHPAPLLIDKGERVSFSFSAHSYKAFSQSIKTGQIFSMYLPQRWAWSSLRSRRPSW
jgi:hypothetical protein